MQLAYILTMPTNNSWNGKWTGENNFYARTRSYRGKKRELKANQILKNSPYYYRWDDGWSACVEIKKLLPRESQKINRKSSGFIGYDWMIDSIEDIGKILASHERYTNPAGIP